MNLRKILFSLGGLATLAMVMALSGLDARAQMRAPGGEDLTAAREAPAELHSVAVTDVAKGEHVMGEPDAPNTIIEYASLTCPHCASFHQETLPKLKKEWIDTGKAKLVYRHYPLDKRALRAALLANCFEGERFFAVVDMLFKTQMQWARADKPLEHFARIAGVAGLNQERFEACMTDEAMVDKILDKQLAARQEVDISSTPSFLVNGEKITGNQDYEAFLEHLEDPES